TDARRLAAKLKDRSDTEARRRRHIYAEAIFVTDKGLNLLREIIREGKSWDNKLSAALVVAKWLEPAQTRMVLAGMKNVPKYLRVKMIVKQPLGKAERAQAIKTLRGLVARVKKTGRPVNCSVEEFKIAKEAAQKLGTGGHPKAMEALADFLLQRPYDADSRGGQYRPWWGCKKALGDLCRGSPRQYLRVKAGLKNDEDDRWDKVVREWESRASKPQWLGKKDMLKALASLSAEQSQDRSQLRLGVLGYYGTKVSDPRSAAGIAALARAMFGRPDSPRAAPYSQRYERMCMADLVERVIAHEFGLRGRYAIRACEHLPEKDRVEKLSAILTRLAKTQVNGGG
ncbi:MAG: hypothetical protein ISS78_06860, partial [Phycisphaerae bacterium]|nr:hypothetical protein [Phycisphaerae bacterium]